jgi:hypothetical protein
VEGKTIYANAFGPLPLGQRGSMQSKMYTLSPFILCLLMRYLLLILVFFPQFASAADWQICDLAVRVNSHNKTERQMDVTILKRLDKSAAVCPLIGERMVLAKKNWPKTGALIKMRYQYLEGICKDRGPCIIKHYPLYR